MSDKATRQYLESSRLNLSEWQQSEVSKGRTPSSIPACLIVREVEFVRTRIWPPRELGLTHREELLDDYRVHFMDGTYDCKTQPHRMAAPQVGKFCGRTFPPSGRMPVDFYTTWDEAFADGDGSRT